MLPFEFIGESLICACVNNSVIVHNEAPQNSVPHCQKHLWFESTTAIYTGQTHVYIIPPVSLDLVPFAFLIVLRYSAA
jgi:hypothetical protein